MFDQLVALPFYNIIFYFLAFLAMFSVSFFSIMYAWFYKSQSNIKEIEIVYLSEEVKALKHELLCCESAIVSK